MRDRPRNTWGNLVTVNEIVSIRENIGAFLPEGYGDTTLEET